MLMARRLVLEYNFTVGIDINVKEIRDLSDCSNDRLYATCCWGRIAYSNSESYMVSFGGCYLGRPVCKAVITNSDSYFIGSTCSLRLVVWGFLWIMWSEDTERSRSNAATMLLNTSWPFSGDFYWFERSI